MHAVAPAKRQHITDPPSRRLDQARDLTLGQALRREFMD
jgi:hypothetical protein